MSEYSRYTDHNGMVRQVVDAELAMAVDRVTGERVRLGNGDIVRPLAELLEWYLLRRQERYVIVRLNCIAIYPVKQEPKP